jgi:hypothetical protein
MDYVYKYLAPYAKKMKSYFDLYLVIFFPAAIPFSKIDDYVFETKNLSRSKIARGNPTMDFNKDSMITMGEFKRYLVNTVQEEFRHLIFDDKKKS